MPKQNQNGQIFTCAQCNALLFDYLSELLDGKTRAQIEGHLSTCPECRKELEEIRAMLSVLGSVEEIPLPLGYAASLHEKLVDVSKEIRGELAPPETESLLQKLGGRFRDFVVHTNWRVAAPAMLAAVLVVSVFSTGLYQAFRNSDDVFDHSGTNATSVQTTRTPQSGATPAPGQAQEQTSMATAQPTAEVPSGEGAENRAEGKIKNTTPASAPEKPNIGGNEASNRDKSTGQKQKQTDTRETENSGNKLDGGVLRSGGQPETPAVQDSVPTRKPETDTGKAQAAPQTSADDSAPKTTESGTEQSASGRSAEPETEAVPETYSMPMAADVQMDESADESMAGGADQPPSNNMLQSSAPSPGGGGTGAEKKESAQNPVYSLSAPNVNDLLKDWGVSGSEKQLTMSREEFESFRSHVERNGGSLTLVESGDGDTVTVRVSR